MKVPVFLMNGRKRALGLMLFLHTRPPLQTKRASLSGDNRAALLKHYCSVGAVQMMSFPPAAALPLFLSLSRIPSTQNAAHVRSYRLGGGERGGGSELLYNGAVT